MLLIERNRFQESVPFFFKQIVIENTQKQKTICIFASIRGEKSMDWKGIFA